MPNINFRGSAMGGQTPSVLASIRSMIPVILNSRRNRHYFLVLLVLSLGSLIFITQSQSSFPEGEAPFGFDSTSTPITKENNHWRGNTVAREIEIPAASWTCTDDHLSKEEKDMPANRRTRQCVIENLCVDRKGGFIRSGSVFPKDLPKVNLMSSDDQSDTYWRPRVERIWKKKMKAHYVDETLFVHAIYSPFHFSHWLYNGMMPLYSTMERFGATKDSWTFRPERFSYDPIDRQGSWEMDHFFRSGKELVLKQYELSTPFQSLPPADAPICFKRAVVGLGSQCALDYCEKNIPTEVYQSFKDEIAEYYWDTPQTWEKHLAMMQETIDREQHSRRKMSTTTKHGDNSPLKCMELARYYNFEGTGQDYSLKKEEHSSRIGQRFPDAVDLESSYRGEGGSKRKLVVGIIQREASRRIINDEELVAGLVKVGFRVKWISFDHGCGLAETAYLLRDINVIISPHGNAIGTSIFMPAYDPVPTVISVDPSRYNEDWFVKTCTALGQRFVTTTCGPNKYKDEATKERCPFYKDVEEVRRLLKSHNLVLGLPTSIVKTDEEKKSMTSEELNLMRENYRTFVQEHPTAQALAEEEIEMLIAGEQEQPNILYRKYGEDIWPVLATYWKALPRYIDVPRVVKFMESLQEDLEREKEASRSTIANGSLGKYAQYIEYVGKDQACNHENCPVSLSRNVAGKISAFGQYSTDNIPRWGQQKPDVQALGRLNNFKTWDIDV